MAIIENNILMKGMSGMLGGTLVFRQVRGKTIVAVRPGPRRTSPTKRQRAVNERFKEVAQFARLQMQDPQAKAAYAAGITRKKFSAYMVAMMDYFKAPEVRSIDTSEYHGLSGDRIIIQAVDDFEVLRVTVAIRAADGTTLESGDAKRRPGIMNRWLFRAATTQAKLAGCRITVSAYDRPGNVTSKHQLLF